MAQTVTPDFLLQVPPGWSLVGKQTLRTIDPGAPPPVQLEGYEWFDVSGLGLGGTQASVAGAVQKFRQQVQALGSDLYAVAVIKKTEVNINVLGLQIANVDRYRLVLCHSQAQILGWMVVILGIAVAALILYQYVTTGQSPTLDALGRFWSDLVQKTGAGIGAGVNAALVPVFLVGGALLLVYAVAAKELGVGGAKPPHTRVGLRPAR